MLLAVMLVSVFLQAAVCEETEAMKEIRWGNQVKGVALAVKPNKLEYESGVDINLEIFVKNFSKDKKMILNLGGNDETYRIELFNDDGVPVMKTSYGKQVYKAVTESTDTNLPTAPARSVTHLESGEKESSARIMLNRYFNIHKPGTYHVIIMRRIWGEWKNGFLVSNMAKIRIVESQAKASD
jgi:hypothetical protein